MILNYYELVSVVLVSQAIQNYCIYMELKSPRHFGGKFMLLKIMFFAVAGNTLECSRRQKVFQLF